jgi:hypothetical protein
MRRSNSHLDAFTRGVHRRAVAWRVVERAGVGLAIGAIAAVVLLGAAMARDIDGRMLALGVVVAGVVTGLVDGIVRRPTSFDAVAEADRQLGLADLLTTAVTVRSSNDAWDRAVVAQAGARARSLHPRDVVLQKLGVRAWGGIGIATAIVGVMTALSTTPTDVRATGGAGENRSADRVVTRIDQTTHGSNVRAPHDRADASSKDGSAIPVTAETSAKSADVSATGARGQTSGGGTRGAADRSPISSVGSLSAPRPSDAASRSSRFSAGDGEASTDARQADVVGAGRVAASRTAVAQDVNELGPMTRDPGDRGPLSPVQLQSVPDAYRDVVRDYFDDGSHAR